MVSELVLLPAKGPPANQSAKLNLTSITAWFTVYVSCDMVGFPSVRKSLLPRLLHVAKTIVPSTGDVPLLHSFA